MPLSIPVGSVTRVDSLVVTDTFGVRSLLRPLGDPALPTLFLDVAVGDAAPPGRSNRRAHREHVLLPPTIGRSIDGAPLEDVLFMRDEMANLAWGIERSIENAAEAPLSLTHAASPPEVTPPSTLPGAPPRYLLATTVPDNWVPLLPVQLDDHGTVVARLRRGAVLQPDGTNTIHPRGAKLSRHSPLRCCTTERFRVRACTSPVGAG